MYCCGQSRTCPYTSGGSVKSPSTARAYGSSSSFAGLCRAPVQGSQRPCTRNPYRCPGRTPGTKPCQISCVSSVSEHRVSPPSESKRHSSTASAPCAHSAKLVPAVPSGPWWNRAPSGCEDPGHTTGPGRAEARTGCPGARPFTCPFGCPFSRPFDRPFAGPPCCPFGGGPVTSGAGAA